MARAKQSGRTVAETWSKPGVPRAHGMRCYWARLRAVGQNGRARRRGVHGAISGHFMALQWTVQDGRCFWCSADLAERERRGEVWHIDHITPFCLDGTNEPHNVVISCAYCNMAKGRHAPLDSRMVVHSLNRCLTGEILPPHEAAA